MTPVVLVPAWAGAHLVEPDTVLADSSIPEPGAGLIVRGRRRAGIAWPDGVEAIDVAAVNVLLDALELVVLKLAGESGMPRTRGTPVDDITDLLDSGFDPVAFPRRAWSRSSPGRAGRLPLALKVLLPDLGPELLVDDRIPESALRGSSACVPDWDRIMTGSLTCPRRRCCMLGDVLLVTVVVGVEGLWCGG